SNIFFFISSRRRHTRSYGDWSSDVCSSDLHRRRLPAKTTRMRIHAKRISQRNLQLSSIRLLKRETNYRPLVKHSCYLSNRFLYRSEERRVGKECRSRCGSYKVMRTGSTILH